MVRRASRAARPQPDVRVEAGRHHRWGKYDGRHVARRGRDSPGTCASRACRTPLQSRRDRDAAHGSGHAASVAGQAGALLLLPQRRKARRPLPRGRGERSTADTGARRENPDFLAELCARFLRHRSQARPCRYRPPSGRVRARRDHPGAPVTPCRIILIKTGVYDAGFRRMRAAGLPVIDQRMPFPGNGNQLVFDKLFTRALRKRPRQGPRQPPTTRIRR